MEPEKKANQEKKVYEKPTITKVELIAEEAVLSACKQGNPQQGSCSVMYTCLSGEGS
jgi:hypothetical protein